MKKFLYLFFFLLGNISNAQSIFQDSIIQKPTNFQPFNCDLVNFDTTDIDSIANVAALKGFKEALQHDSIINVLALGDSRVEQPTIMEPLREKLIAKFGYAGIGYYSTWDYYPRGIVSNTGTQVNLDQKDFATWNIHGKAYSLDATTMQYNQIKTSNDSAGYVKTIKFYYLSLKEGGKFRILVNNKIIDTIDTKSTETTPVVKTFFWVSNAILKGDVTIRTEAVYSISYLLGMDIRNGKKGIVFHRCGNGTATTQELWNWHSNNNIGYFFANELKPSLIISLMGVNRGQYNEPLYQATYLLNVFNIYKSVNKSLSVIMLGETGARISDEEEDNLNLAYYMASFNYSETIMFINLKDIVKDWASFSNTSGMAWTIGDNVHWGKTGGNLAANYIWNKIKSGENKQSSIFPRFYKQNQNNSKIFCDISKNADVSQGAVNLSFLDLHFIPSKIEVRINGIPHFHKDSGKKPYWLSNKTIIEAIDDNNEKVIIDTIEVRIKE